MRAEKKLRWLGRLGAVVFGLGALVLLLLWSLTLIEGPPRPRPTYSRWSNLGGRWLDDLILPIYGLCGALLGTSLLVSFGSRLARISAIVIGSVALVVGAVCQVYTRPSLTLLDLVLALLATIPGHVCAAYLTALGIASFSEARPRVLTRTERWLTQPELLALLLFGGALLVDKALHPFTVEGIVEKQNADYESCSRTADLDRYCGGALALTFVPQDSSLVLLRHGSSDDVLEKYSATSPRTLRWSRALKLARSSDYNPSSRTLSVSSDGATIVLTAPPTVIERFDGTTGASIGPVNACAAAGSGAPSVAVSPDGRTLAIGKRAVCLVPTASASVDSDTKYLEPIDAEVVALVFAPSSTRLWVLTSKQLAAWDLATRARVVILDARDVSKFALSSDGKYLVTSSYRTEGIDLWDAETGVRAGRVEPAAFKNGNPPNGHLAFLPDSRRVIVLASYGYYVLDPFTGAASRQRDYVTIYHSVAPSADGRWAAFAKPGFASRPIPSFKFVPDEQLQIQP